MTQMRNIPGVAYSQRPRFSNASVIMNDDARIELNDTKKYLVAVTAWSGVGGPYGHVEVEVVSTPTLSANTTHVASANESAAIKAATTVLTDSASEGFPAGTPSYPSGTVLKLKAITNSNGKFVGWADGVAAATRTVTVTANAKYTARFISAVQIMNLRLYCLNSRGRIMGEGLTEETANNQGVLTRVYTADVKDGDSITFKATAKEGYTFVRWNVRTGQSLVSGVDLTSPKLTLRMTHSASLEAIFEVEKQDPNDNPGGGGTVDPPTEYPDDPPYGGDETPEEIINPGAGGGGGSYPSEPGANEPLSPASIIEKAKPFVKKWWWAILIVAYVIYKERKGGSK